MYNLSHKDFSCLYNIVESISKIQQYSGKFNDADSFLDDSISFEASMMNFIIIGEMAEKLSEKFVTETSFKIDWFKVRGFRNIIAHNYFGIDAEEVWQIIHTSLKDLKNELDLILKK